MLLFPWLRESLSVTASHLPASSVQLGASQVALVVKNPPANAR